MTMIIILFSVIIISPPPGPKGQAPPALGAGGGGVNIDIFSNNNWDIVIKIDSRVNFSNNNFNTRNACSITCT